MVKMINNKGQIKVQQTAFMLLAVTLFLALAGLFVFTIIFSNLRSSTELAEQKEALRLVSKLANSPEFSCEDAFGRITGSCIDFDKVIALKKYTNNYADFWGISGIEIRKVYPVISSIQNVECTESNYPDCDRIIIMRADEGLGFSNFVSLCRKSYNGVTIQDVCEIAKIIVTYKNKK